ncbi:uncharacterized protein LOC130731468 isoform X2 [Lotus japonicus]|uniref:uncharacterized protein LOC130731468 isoform X2 n=1 Tax=Lotus japonicus TaxID=34305 RepID=UPI00258AFC53|nr:uncharacterized protein LOC130731468 isoform X2 [Lotus japonicus]
MAVNCIISSTQIPIQKYRSFLKYPNRDLNFISKRSFVPLKEASLLRIKASISNKGIVCYQDEHGEIVCEGYDEGPCFKRISKPSYHPSPRGCADQLRDSQITNLLLRQSWVQIVKGDELSNAVVEGMSLQEDLNCNGSNSFC